MLNDAIIKSRAAQSFRVIWAEGDFIPFLRTIISDIPLKALVL